MVQIFWLACMLAAEYWLGGQTPAIFDVPNLDPLVGRRIEPESKQITEVLHYWDNHLSITENKAEPGGKLRGLAGRVYFFNEKEHSGLEARGSLVVSMFGVHDSGSKRVKLEEWKIDAESLKKLRREDRIGNGYTLFLPWQTTDNPNQIELEITYEPSHGKPIAVKPFRLSLRYDAPVVQAAAVQERKTTVPKQMSLEDIVTLSKLGAIDDIIVRQIELTESVFQVSTKDLVYLLEQNVGARVIRVMQESGAAARSTQIRGNLPSLRPGEGP